MTDFAGVLAPQEVDCSGGGSQHGFGLHGEAQFSELGGQCRARAHGGVGEQDVGIVRVLNRSQGIDGTGHGDIVVV